MSNTRMDLDRIKRQAQQRAHKARSLAPAQAKGVSESALESAVTSLLESDPRMLQSIVRVVEANPDRLLKVSQVEGLLKEHEKGANEVASRHIQRFEREHEKLGHALRRQIDTTLDEIKARMLRKLEISLPDIPPVTFTHAHYALERVVRKATLRNHVMLVGPAGSGKGFGSRQLAEALGLDYYAKSCSVMDTKSDWLGFIDAGGTYRGTPFRWAYENGGTMFIDEADAANPQVFVLINAALSDGVVAFPDGMVKQHPDFVVVAAANTWGRGADRQYRGRAIQDAASLNRFQTVRWDYDEALELAISPNEEWTKYIQFVRKAMFDHNMHYVISPRQSIMGGKELLTGAPLEEVAEDTLYNAWSRDDLEKVTSALSNSAGAWAKKYHRQATAGLL